jgi:acetolactate synthase-1/2/3 large subunit
MNGAQALIRTLVAGGVDVCFTNPGTSEMHFVAALDDVPEMRGVLGLHEGVVTGAADGYARMAARPAATLLHLGPGLGNGFAGLHNARRAHSPVVNIVGDHATYHKRFDAPLESDIESLANALEGWYRASATTADISADAAAAIAAAMQPPGRVATLVLPADVSWGDGAEPLDAGAIDTHPAPEPAGDDAVDAVARVIASGEPCALLLGGRALLEDGLTAAGRIGGGAQVPAFAESFPARIERGAGLPAVTRLGYLAEHIETQLAGVKHLILAGARAPSSFFAYPGRPSYLVPEGCTVHTLATGEQDVTGLLAKLADAVAGDAVAQLQEPVTPAMPSGELTAHAFAEAFASLLPEGAIVSDESNTSGASLPFTTAGSARHDLLTLTGGAIGQGLPVATGAAIACPDRQVICLEADGSAMYSISALWTQAREGLNVVNVILNNSAYSILRMELLRTGATHGGERAGELFDLSRPDIDFVAIAGGMGVPGTRARTVEEFAQHFGAALAEPGPHVIEVVLPPLF